MRDLSTPKNPKTIEQRALIVGLVVNVGMVVAGYIVFFLTGLQAMFLDANFTVISVVSGIVAMFLSKHTARTTDRYPKGKYALEPIYAIGKATLTIGLLVYSFMSALRVAIDYFAFHVGEPMDFGPVIVYEILSGTACLLVVWHYRSRNKAIGNISTMLRAEANGTWIDGMISIGICAIAVFLTFLPMGTPLDFLHYTGDFFITAIIVAFTIKDPILVLRDAFVELVGGEHRDEGLRGYVEERVNDLVPDTMDVQRVHIFKKGMNFDVNVVITDIDSTTNVTHLRDSRTRIEQELESRLHIVNVIFEFES